LLLGFIADDVTGTSGIANNLVTAMPTEGEFCTAKFVGLLGP